MQWVKGPVLSLQQPGSLLCFGFNPWPRNIHMLWAWPKKKTNKVGWWQGEGDPSLGPRGKYCVNGPRVLVKAKGNPCVKMTVNNKHQV